MTKPDPDLARARQAERDAALVSDRGKREALTEIALELKAGAEADAAETPSEAPGAASRPRD